jgi:S-adenosylmethionine:tRNA ribosyltransferase-isomerase
MRMAEFDYNLPEALIAQRPVSPRDSSRLLVVEKDTGALAHGAFRDLPDLLAPGDLLVLNDTRVIPARLRGRKAGSGGQAEVLLLTALGGDRWEALVRPGRRLHPGATVVFGEDRLRAEILAETPGGGRLVQLAPGEAAAGVAVDGLLHALGELPLPPYITAGPPPAERGVYQTIYAAQEGSSAAPTAGLHFTDTVFAALAERGIGRAFVTLHVGLGTFRPVQVEHAEEHEIHEEIYVVSPEAAAAINATRARGGRVVAVGTTSARTLESAADEEGQVHARAGATRLYIMPGYRYRAVDALLTNFHQPRSTLLLLVAAFAGQETMRRAYAEAVARHYRFLSFGDAMLIR